jgi:peptide/nickel transport system ATP-binding protein
VLDAAASALDVTVQARILALPDGLRQALGLTYVFVSHDLAVARQIADTVSVMHAGRQVDCGPVETVFATAASPYTLELIEAIPGRRAPRAEAEPARMSG